MLTQTLAVDFLIEHGLISLRAIVEGDLRIVDTSRRHTNLKVISRNGPSFLVKQGNTAEKAASLAHEAALYSFLNSDSRGKLCRPYLPACRLYDPDKHILVLELFTDGENLYERCKRTGRVGKGIAADIGEALGILHSSYRVEGGATEHYPRSRYLPPDVLSVHRPNVKAYGHFSMSNLKLLQIIQQFPEYHELLLDLRNDWDATTLAHGDIKWENWVLVRPAARSRKSHLRLIDWELAGLGDPCWDTGSVFSSYLSFWLLSFVVAGDSGEGGSMQLARRPLGRMQPAMFAFWQAYIERMELGATESRQWLRRSVRYAAARLLQTAFEHMQTESEISGSAVYSLQVSLNMLKRPEDAALYLLGIPPDYIWDL